MALPFDLAPAVVCPTCLNRRHVRTPDGWARCHCLRSVVTQQYIKSALREQDTAYPVAMDAVPPIPFTPLVQVHRGKWDTFRRMAWRTLTTMEPRGFSYDVIQASRLNDIEFNKEVGTVGYESLSHLADLHLLILLIKPATPTHKWVGYTIAHILDLRKTAGLPTWVFTFLTGNALAEVFAASEQGVRESLRDTFTYAAMTEWK
jgi:hypothetical protein